MCMLSLTGVYPDEIGSTILLTRLERGSTPITVRIPTADRKVQINLIYLCRCFHYFGLLPNATHLKHYNLFTLGRKCGDA